MHTAMNTVEVTLKGSKVAGNVSLLTDEKTEKQRDKPKAICSQLSGKSH